MAYRRARQRIGLGAFSVPDLAAAIRRMEGTCPSPSSCTNNNPGNLVYAGQPGATGQDSRGFAVFPDYQSGEAALERQISLNVSRGLTLDQFFTGGNGYPGYDKTNPAYSANVGQWLQIPTDVPLETLVGGRGGGSPAQNSSDASAGLETPDSALSSVDWENPLVVGAAVLAAGLLFVSLA